ncbi:MAG: DVU_1557 family redox protein [bacterium]
MKDENARSTAAAWVCGKCGAPLSEGKVVLAYGGSHFTTNLPRCGSCGLVLVPEALALGKMAEAEQILEDK